MNIQLRQKIMCPCNEPDEIEEGMGIKEERAREREREEERERKRLT